MNRFQHLLTRVSWITKEESEIAGFQKIVQLYNFYRKRLIESSIAKVDVNEFISSNR